MGGKHESVFESRFGGRSTVVCWRHRSSGGLIVSRLENRGWHDTVRFATATSALKHSIPGDFCLVTRREVDQVRGYA